MNERSSSEHLSQSDLRIQQLIRRLMRAGLVRHPTSNGPTSGLQTGVVDHVSGRRQAAPVLHSAPQLVQITQQLTEVAQQVQALHEQTGRLEKQINRSGREQLKANSHTEAHMERLDAALELLRTADTRRDDEIYTLRAQTDEQQATARLQVVQALFPALDGLDEALRSGEQLLQQAAVPPASRPSTLFQRLMDYRSEMSETESALRQKMEAWLVGLNYVRQRLFGVLESEGVVPIPADGYPFDPRLHIALDVIAASDTVSAGMVAAELRRGYLLGERVLRHSEVVVAKEQDETNCE